MGLFGFNRGGSKHQGVLNPQHINIMLVSQGHLFSAWESTCTVKVFVMGLCAITYHGSTHIYSTVLVSSVETVWYDESLYCSIGYANLCGGRLCLLVCNNLVGGSLRGSTDACAVAACVVAIYEEVQIHVLWQLVWWEPVRKF